MILRSEYVELAEKNAFLSWILLAKINYDDVSMFLDECQDVFLNYS